MASIQENSGSPIAEIDISIVEYNILDVTISYITDISSAHPTDRSTATLFVYVCAGRS